MKDDDEEEENTFGVVRYPCMPSLVALQQMRNRLHLAFLGRKLMKWTALATGREMRRIAVELYDVYQGFGEDMRNAFILLARSRYFYPQLNHIVTEDIAKKAAVIVQQSSKSVSGVKIVQFEIFETEYPPYEHLGIEKGGQTIMETKKAWLDLLRRLIMMMQLRNSFIMVELANKNATKKMNVLKKIVVPRTNVTIGYILTELEEMAREEFHRMKKIKEKKKKESQLRHTNREAVTNLASNAPCRICETNIIGNINYTENLNKIQVTNNIPKKMSQTVIVKINEQTERLSNRIVISDVEQMEHEEVLSITSAQRPVTREASTQSRLTYLITHLSELIVHGRELLQTNVKNFNINEFIKMCKETKLKLDQFLKVENPKMLDEKLDKKLQYLKAQLHKVIDIMNEFQSEVKLSSSVENFIRLCQNVGNKLDICKQIISVTKDHKNNVDELRDIINDIKKITIEYKKQGLLTHNVESFLKSCDIISSKLLKFTTLDKNNSKLKLDQEFKPDQQRLVHEELDRKLEHLKCHLREVIDVTEEFKPKLKISPSVEEFVRICQEVNEKLEFNRIEEGEQLMQTTDEKTKLEKLREIINGVAKIIQDYKKKGIVSVSVDEFLESCDKIKLNIDKSPLESTKKLEIPGVLQEKNKILKAPLMKIRTDVEKHTNLQKLINHIDDAIGLSLDAKEEGFIDDSADDFLKVFEEIKNQIASTHKASNQPKILKDLQLNIQEIMNLIKNLNEDGVITTNVEDILKSSEKAETKIDIYNKRTPSCSKKNDTMTMSECIDSCITRNLNVNLTKDNEQEELRSQSLNDKDALCTLCSGVLDIKEPSDESLCIGCSNSVNKDTEIFQSNPATISEDSNLCDYREKINSKNTSSVGNEATKIETLSSSENLGYFEKKMQKKTKVTRRQNPDGTVWEEKKTITINKVKHDPTETFLLDDEDDSSDEDFDKGSSKQVNICIIPNLIRKDVNRISKSAHSNTGFKNNSITEPFLRQYFSLDNIFFDC